MVKLLDVRGNSRGCDGEPGSAIGSLGLRADTERRENFNKNPMVNDGRITQPFLFINALDSESRI